MTHSSKREPFAIGSVGRIAPVLPAPMAGMSDRAWRDFAREMGCNLVYTEMVSAEGASRADGKTLDLMDMAGEPPPICVQLFGKNPEAMAEAGRVAEARGAAIVDINAGCPARKVSARGSGAGLLRDLPLLRDILAQTRRAVKVPLTLKYRSGWDDASRAPVEIARMAEGEGVDALTLHPRTREQWFRGVSDWRDIADVKAAVAIPVIGNGDVRSGADARRMVAQAGCDAVMIARAVMGNFWVLRAALRALTTDLPDEECDRAPPLEERLATLLRHARREVGRKGERRGVIEMRKFFAGYIREARGAKQLRIELMGHETLAGLEAAVAEALERWRATARLEPHVEDKHMMGGVS